MGCGSSDMASIEPNHIELSTVHTEKEKDVTVTPSRVNAESGDLVIHPTNDGENVTSTSSESVSSDKQPDSHTNQSKKTILKGATQRRAHLIPLNQPEIIALKSTSTCKTIERIKEAADKTEIIVENSEIPDLECPNVSKPDISFMPKLDGKSLKTALKATSPDICEGQKVKRISQPRPVSVNGLVDPASHVNLMVPCTCKVTPHSTTNSPQTQLSRGPKYLSRTSLSSKSSNRLSYSDSQRTPGRKQSQVRGIRSKKLRKEYLHSKMKKLRPTKLPHDKSFTFDFLPIPSKSPYSSHRRKVNTDKMQIKHKKLDDGADANHSNIHQAVWRERPSSKLACLELFGWFVEN